MCVFLKEYLKKIYIQNIQLKRNTLFDFKCFLKTFEIQVTEDYTLGV